MSNIKISHALVLVAVQLGTIGYIAATRPAADVSGATVPSLSDQHVREIVQAEIKANPKVVLDSLNAYMQEQQAQTEQQADQRVIENKASIADTQGLPFEGNKDGSIELVYFFDVNCVYCKKIDPVLKQLADENPDVRISHREIPILGPSSRRAAILEAVVWERHPDHYIAFHDSLIGATSNLTDADIDAKLEEALGVEMARELISEVVNGSDVLKKATERVDESLAIASAAGVTGTPFVFVLKTDGLIRGASDDAYEVLSGMISKARGL